MSSTLARAINSQHRALFENKATITSERLSVAVGGEALKELFRVAYDDLLVLARARLRRHGGVKHGLDTKTLVHEAYLRLSSSGQLRAKSRVDFFRYASLAMRSVIVDTLRERHALRRGGSVMHEALTGCVEPAAASGEPDTHKLQLVLGRLARDEPRLREIVEMRYYAGLTDREIGATLGLTDRTVRRDWERARRLLLQALEGR